MDLKPPLTVEMPQMRETDPLISTQETNKNDHSWYSSITKTRLVWGAFILLIIIAIVVTIFGTINYSNDIKNKKNCKNNGLAENSINCNKSCKAGSYNLANGDCINCPNGIADNKLNCNKICDGPSNSYNLLNGDCVYCENGVSMYKKACNDPIPVAQNYYKNNYYK